jgi:hypothetical protein
LFIAPDSGAGENDKLYKITGSGAVEEVRYYDEEDKEMPMEREPSAVYNAGKDCVIICYGKNEGYLVRKDDGAVFSLKDVGIPDPYFQGGNYINAKVVQTDALGNIYYIADIIEGSKVGTELVKIDISTPTDLVKTRYVQLTEGYVLSHEGFDITSTGHAIYKGDAFRIRKSNGGLYNLPNGAWWIGLDDKIKLYPSTGGKIMTFTITSSFDVTTSEKSTPDFYIRENVYFYLVRFADRILLLGKGISAGEELIYELENPSGIARKIPLTQLSNVKRVVYSDDFYYVSGNNNSEQPVLLKINSTSDVIADLLTPNQYDIYAMTVDQNDIVTFNALRMSDGAKVIGEISAAGKVRILDEKINAEVTVLERIR